MLKTCYLTILLSVLFILCSIPSSYNLSDTILTRSNIRTTFDNAPGIPTITGTIIHAITFAILTSIVLMLKDKHLYKQNNNIIKIEKPETENIN
jgi:hypothetical protein